MPGRFRSVMTTSMSSRSIIAEARFARRGAHHAVVAPEGLRQPFAHLVLRVDDEDGLAADGHRGEYS